MRALLVDYSRIVRRMQDFFSLIKRLSPFLLRETTLTRFRTNNRKTNFRLTKIVITQFDQNKEKKTKSKLQQDRKTASCHLVNKHLTAPRQVPFQLQAFWSMTSIFFLPLKTSVATCHIALRSSWYNAFSSRKHAKPQEVTDQTSYYVHGTNEKRYERFYSWDMY